jgi:alkanesulfonate monooxygenase SsuD/methylene tetrahydromethanopterin reductase-like flavin-dependent oxidoreductase (luciferase family)
MFTLRFDMRAPEIGAPAADLYSAALDMCSWAETRGCIAAVICEHHASDDGYLPTPLILASAIAARTEQLALNLIVILPFYDPVRLAEEMAVLDIISRGRASYVFGLGYRPEEYEMFGVDMAARGRVADEKLAIVRSLLAGEELTVDGRRINVTPRPHTPGGPMLMWGGGSVAAARRAGRYGLGFLAQGSQPGMQEAYETACVKHGHPVGFALLPPSDTPSVMFVADDVDAAWDELGPHLLHDAHAYAQWNPGNNTSAGISHVDTVDELRATSHSHKILSVEETIDHVRGGGMLTLSPLCGGVPPDIAWPYLERVVNDVLPAAAAAQSGVNGQFDALNDMFPSATS